jgi:hypothetical protein
LSLAIFNSYFFLRTAASIFLSLLVASIILFIWTQSIIAETAIAFTVGIALLYAMSRSVRDKRDDLEAYKRLRATNT